MLISLSELKPDYVNMQPLIPSICRRQRCKTSSCLSDTQTGGEKKRSLSVSMPIEYSSLNFNVMEDLEILRSEREIERRELKREKGKKSMKKGKSLSDHRKNSEVNIITPLPFSAWAQGLRTHPDRAFVDYVVNSIKEGFRIGFNRSCLLKSARSNLPTPQGSLVQGYLSREVSLSRMVTWTSPDMDQLYIRPPQTSQTGKVAANGGSVLRSVNDRISPELVSVQYTRIDHLASLVLLTGRGLALVKADIKEAYHNIPVHPDDHHLLAVQWEGVAYVDRVLPFGLRSGPLIFSAVADAAQRML